MQNNNKEFIKDSDLVYIAPNLVSECLIDNWYAWPHLISPITAALNIKNRHLKILNSFLLDPQSHVEAAKNPKMLGGPFINHGKDKLPEIEKLKCDTLVECKDLLELCDAISELNDLLKSEATGYSMKPLYKKIPDILKGFVELFYDLHNNPSYRFFEGLLYNSKFYKESLQSLNLFKVLDDDSRSFILSTPSLPRDDKLNLKIPFKDKKIDDLFRMSTKPESYEEIKKKFNIKEKDDKLFRSFFTKDIPQKYINYSGSGVLTRYFGHACVLVETKHTSILVDPVISYGYESDISRYTYSDLPDCIDYVLITHNHQDHILLETLIRIRYKIKNIIVPKNSGGRLQDPSLKLMFHYLGFENIIELGDMETLTFKDCSITGIPFLGEHSDLDIRSKLCYSVKLDNDFKILFAADSCNLSPDVYKKIYKIYGKLDVIFLGMECDGAPLSWLYGPLMPDQIVRNMDQTRRLAGCNFEEGKALIELFKPQNVFIYAMGLEPWLKYISSIKYTKESRPIIESDMVLEYCNNLGIDSERLFGEKIIEYNHSDEFLI
ncbi:MBL fold metallo-hydrolase [Aquimarina algiphila]|uniref:MBL fold metallo-hydrolase n=1 Tax=Aquimarina algiphila TaxID=2047982 RepID=UPI00232C235E|nr:MBL fold metallo-hydrolase [Aquimarina algiphila]